MKSCNYDDLKPGDLSGSALQSCTLSVSYIGTVPAWLSLGILVETRPGTGLGSLPLYDPGSGSGLTMTVGDNQTPPVSYEVPTAATACPSTAAPGSTCYALDDLLTSASAFTRTNSRPLDFILAPSFGTTVGKAFQGGGATVVLTANAVQAQANPLPSACSASTVGKPCPPQGTFSWS
jgi:hypothetical protein